MRIASNGSIGIGGNPDSRLHVFSFNAASALTNETRSNDAQEGSILRLRRSRIVSGETPLIVQDNDAIGALQFFGFNDDGYHYTAGIRSVIQGNPANGVMPSKLVFETRSAANNAAPQTRMVIDRDGNVAIGTNNAGAKLHVAADADISLGGGGNIVSGFLDNHNIAINNNEIMARFNGNKSDLLLQADGGDLVVHFNKALSDQFVVKDNGNVGVGSSNPQSQLDVFQPEATLGRVNIRAFNLNQGIGMLAKAATTALPAIQSLGTGKSLEFIAGNENTGNYLFTSSGNLGIGTSQASAKLEVAGATKLHGPLEMTGNKITNLASPALASDGANKNYVDTQLAFSGLGKLPMAPVTREITTHSDVPQGQKIDVFGPLTINFPPAGGPFRVFISYSVTHADSGNNYAAVTWVEDINGNRFLFDQENGLAFAGTGFRVSNKAVGMLPLTYSENGLITFRVYYVANANTVIIAQSQNITNSPGAFPISKFQAQVLRAE